MHTAKFSGVLEPPENFHPLEGVFFFSRTTLFQVYDQNHLNPERLADSGSGPCLTEITAEGVAEGATPRRIHKTHPRTQPTTPHHNEIQPKP